MLTSDKTNLTQNTPPVHTEISNSSNADSSQCGSFDETDYNDVEIEAYSDRVYV